MAQRLTDQPQDACDHCHKPGKLGRDGDLVVRFLVGKSGHKYARYLHPVDCEPAYMAKYNAWAAQHVKASP